MFLVGYYEGFVLGEVVLALQDEFELFALIELDSIRILHSSAVRLFSGLAAFRGQWPCIWSIWETLTFPLDSTSKFWFWLTNFFNYLSITLLTFHRYIKLELNKNQSFNRLKTKFLYTEACFCGSFCEACIYFSCTCRWISYFCWKICERTICCFSCWIFLASLG